MLEANDKNVPGDFYVEKDCCTLCGVPWHVAPALFAHDDHGCWVAKQPASRDEVVLVLKVMAAQELGCVQYRGDDERLMDTVVRMEGVHHDVALRAIDALVAGPQRDVTWTSRLWSWFRRRPDRVDDEVVARPSQCRAG